MDKLNIFIALTNTSKILISSNGINWKVYNIPGTFSYVTWINKLNSLIFLTSDASNTPIYICNLYRYIFYSYKIRLDSTHP